MREGGGWDRRRRDEWDTGGPTMVRQDQNRIVGQVRGLQDPGERKALLGKTARLDFKMVDVRATPEDMAEGRATIGSEVLPYPDDPRGLGMIAVERRPVVNGDQLIDASIGQDQHGAPAVNFPSARSARRVDGKQGVRPSRESGTAGI